MRLTFIELSPFRQDWLAAGLGDDALRKLQNVLLERPEVGAVMQRTGGLRKLRFAPEGRGKSGAFRVCYLHLDKRSVVFLVMVFAKSEKGNLTAGECRAIERLVEKLKEM